MNREKRIQDLEGAIPSPVVDPMLTWLNILELGEGLRPAADILREGRARALRGEPGCMKLSELHRLAERVGP